MRSSTQVIAHRTNTANRPAAVEPKGVWLAGARGAQPASGAITDAMRHLPVVIHRGGGALVDPMPPSRVFEDAVHGAHVKRNVQVQASREDFFACTAAETSGALWLPLDAAVLAEAIAVAGEG